jgi:YHS domain-containing protein
MRKFSIYAIIGLLALGMGVACNDGTKSNKGQAAQRMPAPMHQQHAMPANVPQKEAKPFADVAFAVKKDLICGMPLAAGIADTAHYKGKVYGFCATECKTEFLASPQKYIAASK